MRFFIFIVSCLSAITGFSQIDKKVWYNQVSVPPAPNAASLGKYGDYTVGKSTGSLDVSIPILTIEEAGIQVPINLSYQTSGYKTDDRASWVGYGFSMAAGGVITRSMRGLPDDGAYGFFQNMMDVPSAT